MPKNPQLIDWMFEVTNPEPTVVRLDNTFQIRTRPDLGTIHLTIAPDVSGLSLSSCMSREQARQFGQALIDASVLLMADEQPEPEDERAGDAGNIAEDEDRFRGDGAPITS